ncbi:MAG: Trp biosynthesis-associated membrane protein [Micrococcaceae bacterium]
MNQSTPAPQTHPVPRPTRLTRGRVVLLVILAGALALLSSTQVWLIATEIEALPGTPVESTGQQAAGAVTAMALVAMAGGVALSIAGRIARVIIGTLLTASAVMLIVSTASVILDPARAAQPRVAELSGLTDAARQVSMTWAPWIALVAAVLMLLASVAVFIGGRHWHTTRKYDNDAAAPSTAGGGPDDAPQGNPEGDLRPEAVTTPSRAGRPDPERRTQSRVEEIDAWDDLSQGKDPT